MPLVRLSSARDFFRTWFFWKNYAFFLFIIIIGIVMGFAYITTPSYKTSAKILILPRTGEGVVISSGAEETRITQVTRQDINTEIELLISDEVIRETISSFLEKGKDLGLGLSVDKNKWYEIVINHVKSAIGKTLIFLKLIDEMSGFEATVALLRNSIEVEPVVESNIIQITLEAENPRAAAAVLNRLLDVYIRHHNEVFTKDEGAAFFSDEAQKFQEKLDLAEDELKEYQSQWNILDIEAQNQENIEQLAELNRNFQFIDVSIKEIENKIRMLKAGLKNGVIVTREMKTIPAIVELEKALVPLYIERGEILKIWTKSSREHLNIDTQIKMLQEEIRKEVKKAIATEQLELNSLTVKKNSFNQKMLQLQRSANETSRKEKRLKELQRKIALLLKNYMLYSSKKVNALIFSERKKRNLANVSIADRARIPPKPSYPQRVLFLIMSFIVGSFAALGTPFILEFIDHRIKFVHDIEEMLSLPVISSMPTEKF